MRSCAKETLDGTIHPGNLCNGSISGGSGACQRKRSVNVTEFLKRTPLPLPASEVFDWHLRPGAFERLMPPWEKVEVLERNGGIADGGTVELKVKDGPFTFHWTARHRDYSEENRRFCDEQVRGPFTRWVHAHQVDMKGPVASVLEDRVDYALPLGIVGRWLDQARVRRRLEQLFAYRHAIIGRDVELHRRAGVGSQRILITGSSGLIGGALIPFLQAGGHEVTRLIREQRPNSRAEIVWNPERGFGSDVAALEGFHAVVHLAGEPIDAGRWTVEHKQRIRESRVQGTRQLCQALARCKRKPRVLVCASAIGFYGNRGMKPAEETAAPGDGYLPELVAEWEEASRLAVESGIRVVHLRFGMILSPAGGALRRMTPIFRLGLGAPLGSGEQQVSWLSIEDAIGSIHHAMTKESLRGAVNAASPNPVSNREFTRTLARVLRRPSGPAVPEFVVRGMYGEMADAILLSGVRAVPRRLLDNGYRFLHADLEAALRFLLGRIRAAPPAK